MLSTFIMYTFIILIFKYKRNIIHISLISLIIIFNSLIAIYLSLVNSEKVYFYWSYIDAFIFWNIILGIFFLYPLLMIKIFKQKHKE